MEFDEYLNQTCDDDGCDHPAKNNGTGRNSGKRGKWCNSHTDWNQFARARND